MIHFLAALEDVIVVKGIIKVVAAVVLMAISLRDATVLVAM